MEQIKIEQQDVFELKGELLMPILNYLATRPSNETGALFLELDHQIATQKKAQLEKENSQK